VDVDAWARKLPKNLRDTAWVVLVIAEGLVMSLGGNAIGDRWKEHFEAPGGSLPRFLTASWGWLFILAFMLTVGAVATLRNRKVFKRRDCVRNIKCVLQAMSDCFPKPNRTNIMLVEDSPEGKVRRVDKETACNMSGDPDLELEMAVTAGVSGDAVNQKAFVYGDLTIAPQPGAPTWGLKPHQQSRVRQSLKTIGSTPISDPRVRDGPIFGTLQLDSDLTYTQVLVPDTVSAGKVVAAFADVIALIIAEGDYGPEKR
jgi:hypothetical protein